MASTDREKKAMKILLAGGDLSPSSSSSTSSEWENLYFSSSSSSDDEVDNHWIVLKDKKPNFNPIEEDFDDDENQELESGSDTDMIDISDAYRFYDSDKVEADGENPIFMLELLYTILPELASNEMISLNYVEQQIFPHLPTKILLHLKPASARWTRWISSTFFIHTHSLLSRSISGFFYHDSWGSPAFTSFDRAACSVTSPPLSFLPEPVVVKSTNYGLVCCRGKQTLKYYMCNPTTAEWTFLPSPINVHGDDTAVVMVMQEPMAYNFDSDYLIVCAFEILEGVYGFETFSSEKWEWRKSNEIVAVEKIVPGSGVSACGVAYWRTTMQMVVAFDPLADTWHEMVRPSAAMARAADEHWEIGEVGRKLCCVRVRGSGLAESWIWENGSWGMWRGVGEFRADDPDEPEAVVPLRAQGEREVVVWDGRSKTVVARDVERGTERRLDDTVPAYCADFVPFVSTLVHVKRYQS